MSIPTPNPNQDKSLEQRAFVISIVFLLAITANLILSISQGFQSGAWQHFLRAGIVGLFGISTIFAAKWIRRGRVEEGILLIIRSLLLTLFGTSLLLGGLGLILAFITLILEGAVIAFLLPADKKNRSYALTIIASILIYAMDFLPLNYRIPAPAALKNVLPVIAGLVIFSSTVIIIRLSWDAISLWFQSSVRNRLISIVIGAAIIPALLISITLGIAAYTQMRSALIDDTFDKLAAVEAIKLSQMKGYLAERQSDMTALSETMGSLLGEALSKLDTINQLKHNQIVSLHQVWDADVRDVASDPSVVGGIEDFSFGFQAIGANQVRRLYLGQGELEFAGDESAYSAAHFEQHGFFLGYTGIHGYKNAFLIDPAGNIIYNVHKGDSFGTNLVSGPYKDSNLAALYQTLLTAEAGKSYLADVALFEGENAFFIGTPSYSGATLTGMLVYQIDFEQINAIVNERTGLGETGETFIVAQETDGRITFRSDRSIIGGGKFVVGYDLSDIAQPFMKEALVGTTGSDLSISGTGASAITAYTPVNIEGVNWAILSRIDGEEILVPFHTDDEKDFLTNYAEFYGYHDIFLIHPNGDIFYSVAKEADYHTNILDGEYSDSNLGTLISEVIEEGKTLLSDYAFYAPSGGTPEQFFGAPLFSEATGDLQLIVAAQVSKEDANTIMNESSGLGETGESYLIGPDSLGRSDSRFLEQLGVDSTILHPDLAVDTEASRAAIAGETGQGTIIDYRGLPVLSAWAPIVIHEADEHHPEGVVWAMLTEIDESEALETINQLAGLLGLIIALAALAIIALAVFLGARF
ncbi:MAG: cache domain-containing protein, partial [Anaerolineae bacterium]|nr:cache domain-containing protein [Anaerolineae bacterium]